MIFPPASRFYKATEQTLQALPARKPAVHYPPSGPAEKGGYVLSGQPDDVQHFR
jgi:hypothetical protein